jgi:lipoprotein NlpD
MTTDKNNMLTNSKRASAAFFCAALMAGCSSTSNRAPVEDRMAVRSPAAAGSVAVPTTTEPTKPLPGAENAGKPGYYAVKPGDTLIRIGLDNGQNWKDLVKWNNLDNPNIIEVGQVIRVLPPGVDPNAATVKPVTTAKVETKPLDGKAATPAAGASAPAGAVAPAPAPTAAGAAGPREPDDDVNWMWPAAGTVIAPFDDGKSKGLAIGGKAGDPVYAAADGRVVYAGSGLRGYGNLIILKHNNTYLTAYAHNQALLVKDEQAVKRGQKIAEMGSTDADGVRLHFEIRKQGKPIDPARLLPPR